MSRWKQTCADFLFSVCILLILYSYNPHLIFVYSQWMQLSLTIIVPMHFMMLLKAPFSILANSLGFTSTVNCASRWEQLLLQNALLISEVYSKLLQCKLKINTYCSQWIWMFKAHNINIYLPISLFQATFPLYNMILTLLFIKILLKSLLLLLNKLLLQQILCKPEQ